MQENGSELIQAAGADHRPAPGGPPSVRRQRGVGRRANQRADHAGCLARQQAKREMVRQSATTSGRAVAGARAGGTGVAGLPGRAQQVGGRVAAVGDSGLGNRSVSWKIVPWGEWADLFILRLGGHGGSTLAARSIPASHSPQRMRDTKDVAITRITLRHP